MSYRSITPEECYQSWLRYYLSTKGVKSKSITNFENAKSKPDWIHFVKSAEMCNRNGVQLDYEVLLTALFTSHENKYFDLGLLHSLRGIKIYKNYVKSVNESVSPENIRICILKSFKFCVLYCKDNGIKDLYEYTSHNSMVMPTILSHYNAGNVSIHLLACIPNFPNMLSNYPLDVVEEFGQSIKDNYDVTRIRVLNVDDPIVNRFAKNFEQIFKSGVCKADELAL